jgi:ribosomal protein L28
MKTNTHTHFDPNIYTQRLRTTSTTRKTRLIFSQSPIRGVKEVVNMELSLAFALPLFI